MAQNKQEGEKTGGSRSVELVHCIVCRQLRADKVCMKENNPFYLCVRSIFGMAELITIRLSLGDRRAYCATFRWRGEWADGVGRGLTEGSCGCELRADARFKMGEGEAAVIAEPSGWTVTAYAESTAF
ncbi:hypothetical protein EVAR_79557_1 [Eumeta japonica]|uniref:Uncharacterized protein n=1 Tax=Eumeta variegata TaxID=151549 RepID=A0A4C1UF06_EUMVA|nr:hypothetical protein EVAR_79557_1 [Eumeta japonica]